jgi:hypothetical protein
MNMEHGNLSKQSQEGKWEKRENNEGDEPNQSTICVYGNVTMKPHV